MSPKSLSPEIGVRRELGLCRQSEYNYPTITVKGKGILYGDYLVRTDLF
jgi:hypothetical protein